MTPEGFIDLAHHTLRTALMLAIPPLLISLVVGISISILQSVMQIQEQTMVLVPKMIAMLIVILFSLPWMVQTLLDFTRYLLTHLIDYIH